jgi:hypothetical protein
MTKKGKPRIEPAQPLVLTNDQHATLGELAEIMGLIESMLIKSAARIDGAASRKIQKAPGAGAQGQIWVNAIGGRVSDPKIAALIPDAEREIKEVAEDRNDFIHALFAGDYAAAGYMKPGYQTTSAKRNRTGKSRSTGDLQSIRDRAAKLSSLIDQIARAIR